MPLLRLSYSGKKIVHFFLKTLKVHPRNYKTSNVADLLFWKSGIVRKSGMTVFKTT